MSDDIKISKDGATARLGTFVLSQEDAHSRVAVLFVVTPATEYEVVTLLSVSVKWLLQYGVPTDPKTGQQMAYHGTHIIQ